MRRRAHSPARNEIFHAQEEVQAIDTTTSKWPRILATHSLAAACKEVGEKNCAEYPRCAACHGSRLGSLAPAARYFSCAECNKPVHSPIICPAVVCGEGPESEGIVFCTSACKDTFDAENIRICDLVDASTSRPVANTSTIVLLIATTIIAVVVLSSQLLNEL